MPQQIAMCMLHCQRWTLQHDPIHLGLNENGQCGGRSRLNIAPSACSSTDCKGRIRLGLRYQGDETFDKIPNNALPLMWLLDQSDPPVRKGGWATATTPSRDSNMPRRPVHRIASPLQSQARATTIAGCVKKIVNCTSRGRSD